MTAGTGSASFTRFRATVIRRNDAVKRALTLDVWGRLMRKTPVDTGQVRGSWHATRNEIRHDVVAKPSTVRRDKEGRCTNPVRPPSMPDFAPSMDPDAVYWVTNNTVHITFLNEGSSKQAPAGFVEDAIAETRSAAEGLIAAVVAGDGGL